MLSGMQKVTFCLRAVLVFGSVRENRASSSWNVFGGSSRNAPELRWKRCFADVVFKICLYLRSASDFGGWEDLRITWARAGILRVAFWSVFRVGGARAVKNAVS